MCKNVKYFFDINISKFGELSRLEMMESTLLVFYGVDSTVEWLASLGVTFDVFDVKERVRSLEFLSRFTKSYVICAAVNYPPDLPQRKNI